MNNDWREYYDPQYVLMHHGIKGQKWGVRRFQNADGTLTASGRKHYSEAVKKKYKQRIALTRDEANWYGMKGDADQSEMFRKQLDELQAKSDAKAAKTVDKIEKYSTKASKWEDKAANAKTELGRNISTTFAVEARSKADRQAAKATGESKGDILGLKNQARVYGSSAETYANIANKMKENAQGKTGKEYDKIMNKAIAHLATAENQETYAKAYSDAASQKGLIKKGVAYFNNMEDAKKMKVTSAGRMQTKGDKKVEEIGDAALNLVFGIATKGNVDLNTSGFTGKLRDASYKKQYSADERWDKLAKG